MCVCVLGGEFGSQLVCMSRCLVVRDVLELVVHAAVACLLLRRAHPIGEQLMCFSVLSR